MVWMSGIKNSQWFKVKYDKLVKYKFGQIR